MTDEERRFIRNAKSIVHRMEDIIRKMESSGDKMSMLCYEERFNLYQPAKAIQYLSDKDRVAYEMRLCLQSGIHQMNRIVRNNLETTLRLRDFYREQLGEEI